MIKLRKAQDQFKKMSAPWGCGISGIRIKNGLLHLRQPCFQTNNIELLQVLAINDRPYKCFCFGFYIVNPLHNSL